MTEFLKSNRIALRHCLLYEFLQGKCAEKAFVDVSQTVGNHVMNKKEIQILFRRFAKGKFYKNSKKHDQVTVKDIIQSDKKALRTCILYLSLKSQKKTEENRYLFRFNPSFVMYEEFRKVIGEDVIEYREFDFWFYRFFNGDCDLNYEMDKDKKFSELMEMPLDIMKNIVEYLDIFDRMSLAGTSRSLKTFVEGQKLFNHELILHVDDTAAYISYGIEYRTKSYQHWTSENVRKEAIQDFKAVLSYPNLHLNTLKINFHTYFPTLIAKIADELVSTYQVHLKNLCFEAHSMDPLLKILPLFTPGYLTTIDVSVEKMDDSVMNKVAELEQWKQATRVSVNPDFYLGW